LSKLKPKNELNRSRLGVAMWAWLDMPTHRLAKKM